MGQHDEMGKRSLAARSRAAAVFVCLAVWITAGVVLWERETHDALMRSSSLPGAMADVVFWMAPTSVVYVLLAHNPSRVVIMGITIAALSTCMWWSIATDRHSTASLGPGFLFWFVLPAAMLAFALFSHAVRSSVARSESRADA